MSKSNGDRNGMKAEDRKAEEFPAFSAARKLSG
jgi:hypothetical protein